MAHTHFDNQGQQFLVIWRIIPAICPADLGISGFSLPHYNQYVGYECIDIYFYEPYMLHGMLFIYRGNLTLT